MTAPIAVAYPAFSGIRNVVPCRDPTSSRIRFAEAECGEGSHSGDGFSLSQSRQEKQARTPIVWKTRIDQSRCQISLCGRECSFPKVCPRDFGGEAGDGTGATHQQIQSGLASLSASSKRAARRYLGLIQLAGKLLQESHCRRRSAQMWVAARSCPDKAVPVPHTDWQSGL